MPIFLIIAIALCGSVLSVAVDTQHLRNSISVMQPPLSAGDSALIHGMSDKIDGIGDNVQSLLHQMNALTEKTKGKCESATAAVCDCSVIKSMNFTTSGIYRVFVVQQEKRYYADVYCDLSTSANWMIFQRRIDGSEDFYRTWNDYATGFGERNGEYWLGNEFLHLLTSMKKYRLRVDLEDFDGKYRYADYSVFNIGSSTDKYELTVNSFTGNAGDSLSFHDGQKFTTKDADNDLKTTANCAVLCHGGWWYGKNCYESHLNGVYGYSIEWYHFRGWKYSLKATTMKISPAI